MDDQQQTVNADSNSPTNESSKDILILVVDDDHTSLSVIGGILRSWKYIVETVRSGSEALSILRSKQDKKFDLVVTDIHMPDMNGFELLKRISTDFQVPIVMMSADDSEKTMAKGLECGAAYFMRKPVGPNDLQNLWLYAIPKKNQESKNQKIIIRDTNTSKSLSNSCDQQDAAGSAQLAHITSQGPFPITQLLNPTKGPPEKYYEEIGRRRKLSKWSQKSRGTTRAAAPSSPASLFSHRKQKVAWSTNLHNKFLDALKIIGLDRAVPKKILEVMNVPGLTRENVASHLQKYRIFLKRVAEVAERADGMTKLNRSKFASNYLPLHFGFDLENLDTSDENILRKKLKQELRAIRDPLSMGPSWRRFGTILPNNNVGTSNIPFASNYPSFPSEPNKQMFGEGSVEYGGMSGINEIMHQGQVADQSNNCDMTSDNACRNSPNVNSLMFTNQRPSAFVQYGVNTNSSAQPAGGLVSNLVPQGTNNLGQGYGMDQMQNSGLLMFQGTFGNVPMHNAPSQPLALPNIYEVGNGYMCNMSNNLDISGIQANFSEYLIQQLGGGCGHQTVNSSEHAESVENPFLTYGIYPAQAQLQNKNQESEPIPNQTQQSGEGSNMIHRGTREGSCFGEDFNPWFDQEFIQTQAGNQNANMLITDELYVMCQGFQGDGVNSSHNVSSKN